jgi:hypothetical protein
MKKLLITFMLIFVFLISKAQNYPASKKATLNMYDLPPDVYRIQALIKNGWVSASVNKK